MKTNKKIQNVFYLALKQVKGGNPNNGYAFVTVEFIMHTIQK